MASYISDRRLYVTEDRSEVVEEGDPRAAFLLAGENCEISSDDVAAHGLGWKDGKIVIGAKAAPKPENKMASAPENKAAEPDEAEEWTLKMSPEDYLERHPDGPNAELAFEILAAREESGNGDS